MNRWLLVGALFVAPLALANDVQRVLGDLRRATNRFSHMEEAAFIVRHADGSCTAVRWPSTGIPDSAMWVGPFPEGTVAIAHTHPAWRPKPSTVDVATARKVKLPVYVVTRTQVWKTIAGVAFRVE